PHLSCPVTRVANTSAGKLWRDVPDALPLSYRRLRDGSDSNPVVHVLSQAFTANNWSTARRAGPDNMTRDRTLDRRWSPVSIPVQPSDHLTAPPIPSGPPNGCCAGVRPQIPRGLRTPGPRIRRR